MEFKKKSINALGRNRYGDYIGYRKPKSTACEDGVWVLRDARLIYSDDYTELRANGSNYAQIQGAMVFIVDEDFTADTRTVYMTPKTPDNPHSVHYKIDGDKIYWNDDDFGTTVVNAATYNNLYGAFNGVDYTGNTVSLRTGANAATSVSSEIDFFTTNHGATEVTVGSGETSIFFVAQATRHKTFTTGKELTETVTSLDSEGDGTLFLESNMGSAVGESVDIPTNYSESAITGWVVVYDDEDRTATSSVTVTQEGQAAVPDYLAMDIVSGGTINWKADNSGFTKTISYSLDSGNTWTDITSSTGGTSFNVSAGDKVLLKGLNSHYGNNNTFSGSTAYFNLSGNIMSLIYGDNFTGQTTLSSGSTFIGLFNGTRVISAEHLVLPATTLSVLCYQNMFLGCTSLTTAPALPATALTTYCYNSMFKGCTSLTTAPALPATALAQSCYGAMFQECTSLTTAPELPATTLSQLSYVAMFLGCTSLTTAPELPATTLASYCYNSMFSGCTSLNYVKCLATNISASNCTRDWLAGVAATGTFVKANSTSWGSGASGIPTGWTVEDNDKVFVNFKEGTFLSNTINEYELQWSIFEGSIEDGTLLYSGVQDASEVPAYAGYVYSWGLDSSTAQEYSYQIPSSDYGTTKTYTYELAVLNYNTGTLYTVLTNTLTASIPSSPSGTVTIDVALPDLS